MLPDGTLIVDADSHWSILPDFFTELAPPQLKDRMPRVAEIDGRRHWVFEGHVCGTAGPAAVIARDGSKESADRALNHWDFDEAHVGA